MRMSALFNPQLRELFRRSVVAQESQAASLKTIASCLTELAHPTLNGFELTMSPGDGKNPMNLQIKDDGKGIVFTATPEKNGQPVQLMTGQVPTWTVSDPDALTISTDDSGLVCTGVLPTPAKDASGVTATISLTLTDGTVVSDTSDPFDIVPDPDNVDSFVIAEAAQ